MSIERVAGEGPFVIDRGMPSIFAEKPDHHTLVAKWDSNLPMTFDTQEDAEDFLRMAVEKAEFDSYNWRILPVDEIGEIGDESEWQIKE